MIRDARFSLDPSEPACTYSYDPADENLSEMIQTIFPLDTADAVLNWGDVSFALNYKYDISLMIDDLLELILAITSIQRGKRSIAFVTSGFPYHWDVEWDSSLIQICSAPLDKSRDLVNPLEVIQTSIDFFLDQWRPMFRLINAAAVKSGYKVIGFPRGEWLLHQSKNCSTTARPISRDLAKPSDDEGTP
jgi:hypothetical protein